VAWVFTLADRNRRGEWKGININPLPIAMKLWKQGRTEATAIVPEVRKTTNTKIRISQPRLAGEINGRVGPIGAPTAPTDEGSSE
jgi:hypothetical protein